MAELTTLVRTWAASVRELRVDVTTLRDPTGTLPMSTASGPQPTDPKPADTPAPHDRQWSCRSAASTSPLASQSARARSDSDARSSRSANDCCNWHGLSPVLMPLTGLAPASPYFGLRAMDSCPSLSSPPYSGLGLLFRLSFSSVSVLILWRRPRPAPPRLVRHLNLGVSLES